MTQEQFLITVVDGQGGGIGKQYIDKLMKVLPKHLPVIVRALGTNGLATSAMLKAGAMDGATGENAIVHNVKKAKIIVGVVAIVVPHAILGELTPRMAEAVGASEAIRILIPFDSCNTRIAMLSDGTLSQYIDRAVEMTLNTLSDQMGTI